MAEQTALSLKRDVERLLQAWPRESRGDDAAIPAAQAPAAAASPAPDLNAFKYVGFEHAFRGSIEEIRRRLEEYVPRFDGQAPAVPGG